MKLLLRTALLLLISASTVHAEDQRVIDSLVSLINQSDANCPPPCPADTVLCITYLTIGEQYYISNPDTGLILWQKAHDIASKNVNSGIESEAVRQRFWSFLGESLNNMAVILQRTGNISAAQENLHRSLEIADSINDKSLARLSIGSLGVLYKNQGDVTTALTYYERAYKLAVELYDTSGIGYALNNLAVLYAGQEDYEQAVSYLNESLKIREKVEDPHGKADALVNLGGIYQLQENWGTALLYYKKSLAIREELMDKLGIATCLNNIGTCYDNMGDLDKGMTHHLRSFKLREEIGDVHGMAYSYDNIGVSYFDLGRFDEADEQAQQLMKLAKELGDPNLINLGAKLSYRIAKHNHEYEAALSMYELHIQMRDSVNNEKTQKATIRQQTQHEFEKAQLVKDQREKDQRRKTKEATDRRDNLQYSIILLSLLILGSLILLALQKRSGGGGLGKLSLPAKVAEGLIFFAFLIFFEFMLVLADPYIENWSGGAPGIKLLFNAGIAAMIFPLHAFFESKLKGRLGN